MMYYSWQEHQHSNFPINLIRDLKLTDRKVLKVQCPLNCLIAESYEIRVFLQFSIYKYKYSFIACSIVLFASFAFYKSTLLVY